MSFIICFSGTGKVAIKGNKSRTISGMIAVFINEIIENFYIIMILLIKPIFITDNCNLHSTQLVADILTKS